MKIKKIRSLDDWEKFKKLTAEGNELIIFKYSPFCPTSHYVEHEFDEWCRNINGNKVKVAKINVISARSVSNNIARELNVAHESPQLIWLDENGNVKWHASHYKIDEKDLYQLLKTREK
ncbi:hypothetical protein BMS3Abin03_01650 [bacterium BMS3Abin03]|nr:hypothetical protein BMS3Abin03_01650 [bacterium BMS3Abin03]